MSFAVADPAKGPKLRYDEIEDRLKSFALPPRWEGPLDCHSMAEAGFVYTGQEDLVYCFSCKIELDGWTKHMDPLLRHQEESPTCSFVRQQLQVIKGEKKKFKSVVAPSKPLNPRQTASIRQLQSQTSTLVTSKPIHTVVTGLDEPRSSYASRGAQSGDIYSRDHVSIDVNNYGLEEERLKSFIGWPLNESVHPEQLARAGFVYTGEGSLVQCFQCEARYCNWLKRDDPLSVHKALAPHCKFLPTLASKTKQKQSSACNEVSSRLESPNYTDQATRLQSFKYWGGVVPKEELAEAGFYMIAHRDVVKCFSCHAILHCWERGDNVIERHRSSRPNCRFLNQLLHSRERTSSHACNGIHHPPASPAVPSLGPHHQQSSQLLLTYTCTATSASETQVSTCGSPELLQPNSQSSKKHSAFSSSSPPISATSKKYVWNTFPSDLLASLPTGSQPSHKSPNSSSVLMCPPLVKDHRDKHSGVSYSTNTDRELMDEHLRKNVDIAQNLGNEQAVRIEVDPAPFPSDLEYDPNFVYCKICFKGLVNTLFLPCRHVRTCTECTEKILSNQQKKCPFCREIIAETISVYT